MGNASTLRKHFFFACGCVFSFFRRRSGSSCSLFAPVRSLLCPHLCVFTVSFHFLIDLYNNPKVYILLYSFSLNNR